MWCLALLATLAAYYAAFISRTSFLIGPTRYFPLLDDAMVSMRYARHLVQGRGFVWNVGEPPLEGFTNPLWTLMMRRCICCHCRSTASRSRSRCSAPPSCSACS